MNQHDLAKIQIEHAIDHNPNDYHNVCTKGWFLTTSGELSEGIVCLKEAMHLNPFAPNSCLLGIGLAEYTARRYETAIEALGKVTSWVKFAWLAACYAQLGRDEQARAAAAEVLRSAKTELANPPGNDVEGWRAYWASS